MTLRTRCSDWFKRKLGGNSKAQQEDSHAHFIQVLEEVLEVLEWNEVGGKHRTTKAESATSASEKDDDKSITNRFAGLEVEDYETDGGTEPIPSTSKKSKKTPPARTFDIDDEVDEMEEKMFAIFYLFDDSERIRTFLLQTWKDYGSNTIDLTTASLTTNTALDLVREQCDEFVKKYPDMDGLKGATQIIWIMATIADGTGPNYTQQPGDSFNYELMDVATWCLLPTYQLLDAFTRVLTLKNVPVYNGQYGWYNPNLDRSKMSVREQ